MWWLERQDKRVFQERKQLTMLSTPGSHMKRAQVSKLYLIVNINLANFQEYTYHMNRSNLFSDGFIFSLQIIKTEKQ